MVEIGQKAPEFKCLDDQGKEVSLKDFEGQKVILYFYPKDDTSGCTKEACEFKESFPKFQTRKAVILGISKDSVMSHQKFKAKYDLPFALLSDENVQMCEAYGVWVDKSMYGKTYKGIERTTLILDESGIITHIWRKVKVPGHVEEVLGTFEN